MVTARFEMTPVNVDVRYEDFLRDPTRKQQRSGREHSGYSGGAAALRGVPSASGWACGNSVRLNIPVRTLGDTACIHPERGSASAGEQSV